MVAADSIYWQAVLQFSSRYRRTAGKDAQTMQAAM